MFVRLIAFLFVCLLRCFFVRNSIFACFIFIFIYISLYFNFMYCMLHSYFLPCSHAFIFSWPISLVAVMYQIRNCLFLSEILLMLPQGKDLAGKSTLVGSRLSVCLSVCADWERTSTSLHQPFLTFDLPVLRLIYIVNWLPYVTGPDAKRRFKVLLLFCCIFGPIYFLAFSRLSNFQSQVLEQIFSNLAALSWKIGYSEDELTQRLSHARTPKIVSF